MKRFYYFKLKVLLSHRYGTRCLPTRIIAKEYEILQQEIKNGGSFKEDDLNFKYDDPLEKRNMRVENLFDNCYELDLNEIPARYKLKQLDNIIPNYNQKVVFVVIFF